MADEGGVTLKIDANTAAYIAKLSQLADGHEKVTKHVEGWGSAMDHALGKIAAMAGPLVLVEEVVRNIGEGFKVWKEHIENAGKTASEVVARLRGVTVQTGENRQAVEDQLLSVVSPASIEQRVSGYKAFRQNAPGSEKRVAASEISRQIGLAEVAGYDTNQLAGIAGNVEGARPGAGSFDLAALLLSRTGSQAEGASEMIRRLGEKAGPGGAQAALPYLLASAQAGDRRFSIVNEAANAYTPAFGDFGSYMQTRLAMAGPNQSGLAGAIGSRLSAARADIAGLPGYLQGRAQGAIGDEAVAAQERNRVFVSQAEIENYQRNRGTHEWLEARGARGQLNAVSDPVDSAVMPNIHEGVQRITGQWRGDEYGDRGLGDLVGLMRENNQLMREGNTIDRTKVLKPDAHHE